MLSMPPTLGLVSIFGSFCNPNGLAVSGRVLPSETGGRPLIFFFKCLFIFEREWGWEGQREGDRGSEAGSVLAAASPVWGSTS